MSQELRRAQFHGSGGALFRLYLVNTLLTIVTLGIYAFWAKAKIRAHLYSQTELDGDRFAYHGTGGELFRGWLKAVGLLFVIALVAGVVFALVSEAFGMLLLYGALFLVLFPVALVGSRRYRLSRTSWHGIRFSFRGAWREFLAVYVPGVLLSVVTLGIYYPVFHANVRRFLVDSSYFGSEAFGFTAEGRELIGRHVLAIVLTPFTLGLYWFWYAAHRHRFYWENTAFAGGRFRSTMQGGSLLALTLTNTLLVILTLGLGFAWAKVRAMRFHCECLSLHASADLASVRQAAQEAEATGEGLADILDVELVGADFFGL